MTRNKSLTIPLNRGNQLEQNENSDLPDSKVNVANSPVFQGANDEVVLESLEQNPYEVSYTCLLLPRLSTHQLLGDVADRLQAILKQIIMSYGWRLEFLNVDSEYLQWTIRVLPSTSTTNIMHIVREQTSLQLFADFPQFRDKNNIEDFWAPGYLIFWGSQPHPIEVIRRFIRQTRKQQGIWMDE